MTSLLTSIVRIISLALLVPYGLIHGKDLRALMPLLQEEEAEKLFATTKDKNLFILCINSPLTK